MNSLLSKRNEDVEVERQHERPSYNWISQNHSLKSKFPKSLSESVEQEATPQSMQDMIVVETRPPDESNVAQSRPANDNPAFEQALAGPHAGAWKQAMLEELHAIDANKVWQIEPPPLDRKALGSRWLLTVTLKATSNDTKQGWLYKDLVKNLDSITTRLVHQGYRRQITLRNRSILS